jgi:hypothetical protein
MQRITLAGQTHYAALLQALAARAVDLEVIDRPGSFVTKTIKGNTYWYFQSTELGQQKQTYIGPHSPETESIVGLGMSELEQLREQSAETARLVALAAAGGCAPHAGAEREILKLLESRGVFRAGGVLIGSAAMLSLGNMLGVRWTSEALRTQDIDVAADPKVMIGLKGAASVSSLESGDGTPLIPVPSLNRLHPSTSFKVRGTELMVDFLVPLVGRPRSEPVRLPGLGVSAHPLRYLDYLIEGPVQAAVVGGDGVLVNVPSPARFALHKLITAGERPAAFSAKMQKDVQQAELLMDVLLGDRPGDVILAWEALKERGRTWLKKVASGIGKLEPAVREKLVAVVPATSDG